MGKTAAAFASILLFCSCATNPFPLRPFQARAHGSAAEEWAPHQGVVEWWYATAVLTDADANPYLCQFTVFHGFRFGTMEGYVLHLAVTDVKQGKRWFHEDAFTPNADVYGNAERIAFRDSFISLKTPVGAQASVEMAGKAPGFAFSLMTRLVKPAAWHGDAGILPMGHPDAENERSFYYSFTAMEAEGTLTLGGRSLPVKGSCWLDRQWGRFTETSWDWFSLRLFDGTEMMLFAFPKTGYTRGTSVAADGSFSDIPSFAYTKLGLMRHVQGNTVYQLGWRIRLPDGREYTVSPLAADQGNPAVNTPRYWEGLCDLLSPSGEKAGWCVVEATAGAQ